MRSSTYYTPLKLPYMRVSPEQSTSSSGWRTHAELRYYYTAVRGVVPCTRNAEPCDSTHLVLYQYTSTYIPLYRENTFEPGTCVYVGNSLSSSSTCVCTLMVTAANRQQVRVPGTWCVFAFCTNYSCFVPRRIDIFGGLRFAIGRGSPPLLL